MFTLQILDITAKTFLLQLMVYLQLMCVCVCASVCLFTVVDKLDNLVRIPVGFLTDTYAHIRIPLDMG